MNIYQTFPIKVAVVSKQLRTWFCLGLTVLPASAGFAAAVVKPVITVMAAPEPGSAAVKVTSTTTGATFYYTLDGTVPIATASATATLSPEIPLVVVPPATTAVRYLVHGICLCCATSW